jgi:hypothetical protein
MKVPSWEVYPDELRAALIKRYPTISWRVALSVDGISGVMVWARRDDRVIQLEVPRVQRSLEFKPPYLTEDLTLS